MKSLIYYDILGYLKASLFKSKISVSTFWVAYVRIWATFYSNIWLHILTDIYQIF